MTKLPSNTEKRLHVDLGYRRLETRHVLSASFVFEAGQILLDGFDVGQDLALQQQDVEINGTMVDGYVFTVAAGSWSGDTANPDIELESVNGGIENQLQVSSGLFGGASQSRIVIDGETDSGTNVSLIQNSNSLIASELSVFNITNFDSDLRLNVDGELTIGNLVVADSDPNDNVTTAAQIEISATSDVNVFGTLQNQIDNVDAGVNLSASELNADIAIVADIETMAGNINVNANDSVQLGSTVLLNAQSNGNIAITSGLGGVGVNDGGQIDLPSQTLIDAQSGMITLDSSAADGDVFLSQLNSNNAGEAIVIRSGGQIINNLPDEFVNLNASDGRVTLTAAESIGVETNAVEIIADQLLTKSNGDTFLQSIVGTIDVSAIGNLAVDNSGTENLLLADLDNDGIALLNSGAAGRNTFVTDSVLTISADVIAATAETLAFSAGDSIVNSTDVTIDVSTGHLQLNASNLVALDNPNDNLVFAKSIGVVSADAHIELASDVRLVGDTPSMNPADFGSDASFGTNVDQTLFLKSTGAIVQDDGDLRVRQLGIDASGQVELASVDAFNESLAISASGSAGILDAELNNQLSQLSAIENAEVDSASSHSISLLHRGAANIGSVTSMVTGEQVVGFNSSGSQFVSATDAININQDLIATSNSIDPQITLYSAGGSAENPTVNFAGGEVKVSGVQNFGVVNAVQTFANFIDFEDFVFRGTTEILVLSPDGSANQNIELEFGHVGEAGYRVGIIWDIDSIPRVIEDPNIYVPNVNDPSEAYEDDLYQQNPTTLQQIGGNEGGREIVSKVPPYSKDNVIAHQETPEVFSVVTVRNDQHINLFSGDLNSVDNSLNETSQTLRAEFDAPKRFAIQLPPISSINPLLTRLASDPIEDSAATDDSSANESRRDPPRFETGEMKWVQVRIPLNDLEQVGDEIRLKDPSTQYPSAKTADAFRLDRDIGENETEDIIRSIESNAEAEAGYWYKVFKDYKNRDDELFFYHLKTGEGNTDGLDDNSLIDQGPASDFAEPDSLENRSELPTNDFEPQENSSETRPGLDDGSNENDQKDSVGEPLNRPEPIENKNEKEGLTETASTEFRASLGISASSLLMAAMIQDKKPRRKTAGLQSKNPIQSASLAGETDDLAKVKYTRLSRMQRAIKKLVEDEPR